MYTHQPQNHNSDSEHEFDTSDEGQMCIINCIFGLNWNLVQMS